MQIGVVVYSLSGTTLGVARDIAQMMGAGLTSIEAPGMAAGRFSMVRLAFATLLGRKVAVTVTGDGARGCDLAILAAPVWAGRLAVPMRSWLATAPVLPPRIALVMTGGAPSNAGALDDFARHAKATPVARLYLGDGTRRAGTQAQAIASFCTDLAKAGYSPLD